MSAQTSLLRPLSTSSSAQIGSSDTEHKLKRTACPCDEWGRAREEVEVEVEEKEVAVFPESKPPLFDRGKCW